MIFIDFDKQFARKKQTLEAKCQEGGSPLDGGWGINGKLALRR